MVSVSGPIPPAQIELIKQLLLAGAQTRQQPELDGLRTTITAAPNNTGAASQLLEAFKEAVRTPAFLVRQGAKAEQASTAGAVTAKSTVPKLVPKELGYHLQRIASFCAAVTASIPHKGLNSTDTPGMTLFDGSLTLNVPAGLTIDDFRFLVIDEKGKERQVARIREVTDTLNRLAYHLYKQQEPLATQRIDNVKSTEQLINGFIAANSSSSVTVTSGSAAMILTRDLNPTGGLKLFVTFLNSAFGKD